MLPEPGMSCSVCHLHLTLSYVEMYERNKMMMMADVVWCSRTQLQHSMSADAVASQTTESVQSWQPVQYTLCMCTIIVIWRCERLEAARGNGRSRISTDLTTNKYASDKTSVTDRSCEFASGLIQQQWVLHVMMMVSLSELVNVAKIAKLFRSPRERKTVGRQTVVRSNNSGKRVLEEECL